jgi:hypothetical protein
MSFEKCFRHFSAGSGALPMISQKPSFLRDQQNGRFPCRKKRMIKSYTMLYSLR